MSNVIGTFASTVATKKLPKTQFAFQRSTSANSKPIVKDTTVSFAENQKKKVCGFVSKTNVLTTFATIALTKEILDVVTVTC